MVDYNFIVAYDAEVMAKVTVSADSKEEAIKKAKKLDFDDTMDEWVETVKKLTYIEEY